MTPYKKYSKTFKIDDKTITLSFWARVVPKNMSITVGEVALPYSPKVFEEELKLCSRYFSPKKTRIISNIFEKLIKKIK